MPKNRRAGTTLIEVLVVIVVFLVGILAVVQIFPPGLQLLRTTRNNTVAAQLASTETQRILGQPGQVAEMIVPVTYTRTTAGLRVQIDPTRNWGDLMPPRSSDGVGRIDQDGNVLVDGQRFGDWATASGPNVFSRVVGESRPVPGRGVVNGQPVSVLNLTFGPVYYFRDAATGVGETGVLQVYGNDLARRFGDRSINRPNPGGSPRDWEFFFVDSESTDDTYFPGEDQLWVGPSTARAFRIAFSFLYDNGGRTDQFDVIVQATLDPANPVPYAVRAGNYWVVSLRQLVALPDVNDPGGSSQFDPQLYLGTEASSIRLQRVFLERPLSAPFTPGEPYEYKVVASGTDPGTGRGFALGQVWLSPDAADAKVQTAQGGRVPLQARVDYTVFDWRVMRDEFRVPVSGPRTVKLALTNLKVKGNQGPDGRPVSGVGLGVPTLPASNPVVQDGDFVLVDAETGGVVLGNDGQRSDSGYSVDKSNGVVTLRDVFPNQDGLGAWVVYPTGDPNAPWSAPVQVADLSGRSLRAHYMGVGEWAVQPAKAARNYRLSYVFRANGLGPGECLVGGTPDANGRPQGDPYRLYFPLSDRGQKVIVGELWVSRGTNDPPTPLFDQEFEVDGAQGNVAFVDIRGKMGPNTVFDFSRGYAVRRVRGASMRVRAVWNPGSFALGTDPVANYAALEFWSRSWRRNESQSMQVGGRG